MEVRGERKGVSKTDVIILFSVATTLINGTWASSCTHGRTLLQIGALTAYDKQMIVDTHNRMRQSVALGQVGGQPPAANMMEMKWDEDLARSAERWATSCLATYIHDQGRHNSRFFVGQNSASLWTTKVPTAAYETKPDFQVDAIRKWFNEFRQFSFGGTGHGLTGHYTQMVWAESEAVGCGYAFFYDPLKGFTKNYVCNYGPSGNVYGESPYKKGYPNCYSSGLTESRKYPGLCADKGSFFTDFNNYIG